MIKIHTLRRYSQKKTNVPSNIINVFNTDIPTSSTAQIQVLTESGKIPSAVYA